MFVTQKITFRPPHHFGGLSIRCHSLNVGLGKFATLKKGVMFLVFTLQQQDSAENSTVSEPWGGGGGGWGG
jgi:hypothetical protein